MSKRLAICILISLASPAFAAAGEQIPVTRLALGAQANSAIDPVFADRLRQQFVTADTGRIEFDEIQSHALQPERYIVRVFSKKYHRFETIRIDVNGFGDFVKITRGYVTQPSDRSQMDALALMGPQCPDPGVEFIAFAPNTVDIEQSVTADVAQAAEAAGLKTVVLLKADATRVNYLNYLACPKLKGNFYDGDANPSEIVTVDGVLTSDDLAGNLAGAFRYSVVHIWLACEAYNDPMLNTMIKTTQSQKYAAGINDLEIGPSDQTGACAMKAAIAGNPMQEAFNACYKQLDVTGDHWGFGGNGSDSFGK